MHESSATFKGGRLMIESIDCARAAGALRQLEDRLERGESRAVVNGEWSIGKYPDHETFDGHLHPAAIALDAVLNITVGIKRSCWSCSIPSPGGSKA